MNPVILITGGSRGIGAATARLAAQAGYDVCIGFASDADAARDVVTDVERTGRRALAVRGDVAQEVDVLELFAQVDAKFGRLDALVNNAGIVGTKSRVEDYTLERIQRMFAINVLGSMLCAREAVKRMSTANGGSGGAIVNVSSAASRLGSPAEYVDYAASKGAIDTFTLGLAKEVATEGIRVNAVRPGLIRTDIHASGGQPDRVERMQSMIPVQRAGEVDEIAHAILWLLSPQASYTTAALLDVSGGR